MESNGNTPAAFGKKSFAEILASSSLGKAVELTSSILVDKPKIGLLKGKPSVSLSKNLVSDLAAPYKRSLVGKFSQGRPLLEDIHSYFVAQDLKAPFQIGLLDARHIIINFQCDDDYHRIYSRMIWYIGDAVMRIFKWTTNFHVDKESPIVPIWIELEKLPIFLFQKDILFAIASTIGIPLRLDAATAAIRKPSVARIQVELNLLKERPDSVWIGLGEEEGFWQKIKYCNVPSYCSFCWHVGHEQVQCRVKNPSLKSIISETPDGKKEANPWPRKWVQGYRVKQTNNVMGNKPAKSDSHCQNNQEMVDDLNNLEEQDTNQGEIQDQSAEKEKNHLVDANASKDINTNSKNKVISESDIYPNAGQSSIVLLTSPLANKEEDATPNDGQEQKYTGGSSLNLQNSFAALPTIQEENQTSSEPLYFSASINADGINEVMPQVSSNATAEHKTMDEDPGLLVQTPSDSNLNIDLQNSFAALQAIQEENLTSSKLLHSSAIIYTDVVNEVESQVYMKATAGHNTLDFVNEVLEETAVNMAGTLIPSSNNNKVPLRKMLITTVSGKPLFNGEPSSVVPMMNDEAVNEIIQHVYSEAASELYDKIADEVLLSGDSTGQIDEEELYTVPIDEEVHTLQQQLSREGNLSPRKNIPVSLRVQPKRSVKPPSKYSNQ